MIKFVIAARRKREDTQERYFYEWGIIHVALMLSTPAVMETFRKYVQHYSISGISNDNLIHPLSDMEWDNMADHWVEDNAALVRAVVDPEYLARMRPHVFGDKNFTLQLSTGNEVYCEPGFNKGGVKLVHFLKRKEGTTEAEFNAHWGEQHAKKIVDALRSKGLLRKYIQNKNYSIADAKDLFKGSIFEMGGVNSYDGVEEFWFDNVEQVNQLRNDPELYKAITESEADFVAPTGSFSMVTTERVIYDYSLGEKSSPVAAVLKSDSLEAKVFRQGLSGWNVPGRIWED